MSQTPALSPSAIREEDETTQDGGRDKYNTWKKNAPLFYDTLYTQGLVWPSLTVEWLPSRDM